MYLALYILSISDSISKFLRSTWLTEKENQTTFPCFDLCCPVVHKPKTPTVVLGIFTCLQGFTLAVGQDLERKDRANPSCLLLSVSLLLRFSKAQISLQSIQRTISSSDFTDYRENHSESRKSHLFFSSFLSFCTSNIGNSSLLPFAQKLDLLLVCQGLQTSLQTSYTLMCKQRKYSKWFVTSARLCQLLYWCGWNLIALKILISTLINLEALTIQQFI